MMSQSKYTYIDDITKTYIDDMHCLNPGCNTYFIYFCVNL